MPRLSFDDSFTIDVPESFRFQLLTFFSEEAEQTIGDPRMMQKGASFRPNLVIGRSGVKMTADQLGAYVDEQVKQLGQLPGFNHRGKEAVKLTDGKPAVLIEHSFQNNEGTRVGQMQLYTLHEGEVVVFSCTSLDGAPFTGKRASYRQMLLAVGVKG